MPLVFCATFFVFGSAVGSFFARGLPNAELVSDFFFGFFSSLNDGDAAAWFGAFLDSAVWLLAAFVFSFSVFGVIFIPLFSAAKGFLISFSVAVLTRLYGVESVPAAMCLFGIEAVLMLPFFLTLSSAAISGSGWLGRLCFAKPKGAETYFNKRFFVICGVSFAAAALFAVLKCYGIYPLLRFCVPS